VNHARALKVIRASRGFSQSDVADDLLAAMGASFHTYSLLASDSTPDSRESQMAMLDLLGKAG
jgi:hypothetical protein